MAFVAQTSWEECLVKKSLEESVRNGLEFCCIYVDYKSFSMTFVNKNVILNL